MSAEEKTENTKDRLVGKAKEGVGKLTNDRETEAEGKAQQLKAEGKEAVQDARDTVTGTAKGLGGDKS